MLTHMFFQSQSVDVIYKYSMKEVGCSCFLPATKYCSSKNLNIYQLYFHYFNLYEFKYDASNTCGETDILALVYLQLRYISPIRWTFQREYTKFYFLLLIPETLSCKKNAPNSKSIGKIISFIEGSSQIPLHETMVPMRVLKNVLTDYIQLKIK